MLATHTLVSPYSVDDYRYFVFGKYIGLDICTYIVHSVHKDSRS